MWWNRREQNRSEANPFDEFSAPAGDAAGAHTTRPLLSASPPAHARAAGGSFIIDASGLVLAFDRQMERLTGWSANEVVGRSKDLGIFAAADEQGLRGFRPRPLFEGPVPTTERSETRTFWLHRKDGARLEVRALVTPIGRDRGRLAVEVQRVLARTVSPAPQDEVGRTDPLTRLPDARFFNDSLELSFEKAKATGRPLTLLLVEVDGEESIRAAIGNAVWDGIVQRMAGILLASVREDDLVARLDGPVFALLAEGAGRGDARHIGGRIRKTVEGFVFGQESRQSPLRTTVTIGVAGFPAEGESPAELVRRAHEALEEARRLGRNRVWCYVRRPRVPVSVPVFFDGPSGEPFGTSRDISNSGLFVSTHDPLPLGMRVGVTLRLPRQEENIRLIGRVSRVVMPTEGAMPGVGIEFERFSDRDRWRIESFMQGCREQEQAERASGRG